MRTMYIPVSICEVILPTGLHGITAQIDIGIGLVRMLELPHPCRSVTQWLGFARGRAGTHHGWMRGPCHRRRCQYRHTDSFDSRRATPHGLSQQQHHDRDYDKRPLRKSTGGTQAPRENVSTKAYSPAAAVMANSVIMPAC